MTKKKTPQKSQSSDAERLAEMMCSEAGVQPGTYLNIPFQLYRQIDAVNQSRLGEISNHCPAVCQYEEEHDVETDALLFGRGFHTACLEPRLFPKEYVLWPEDKPPDGMDNKGKVVKTTGPGGVRHGKRWDAFQAANQDKTILREQDYDKILVMGDVLTAHPEVERVLERKPIYIEVVLIWKDEYTGLLMKCRIDILADDDDPTILDYKSTVSAEERLFATSIFSYGYDIQAAVTCMGLHVLRGKDTVLPNFIIAAVEKSPPHLTCTYLFDRPTMRLGWIRARLAIDVYAACRKSGCWPGYSDALITINAPDWALARHGIQLPTQQEN